MKNSYLLEGDSSSLLLSLNKLLNGLSDYEIIKYDAMKDSIHEILKDASICSMFSSNKVILVYNFNSLSEKDYDLVYNYISSPNPKSYLILLSASNFDKRKKIYKFFDKDKAVLTDKDFDLNKYVQEYLKEKDYTISINDIKYFLSIVGSNINDINNELDKLILLKQDDKTIISSDIEKNTIKNFDDNIFNFTKVVLEADIKKSLELYREFTNHGYDEIALINILASQFRTLYQVKSLAHQGFSSKEISTKLGFTNPFRVNMCQKNAAPYSETELLKYLYYLGQMDLKIKQGLGDKKSIFELFLINKNIAIL